MEQTSEIDAIKLFCSLLTNNRDGKYLFQQRNSLPAILFQEIFRTYEEMGQIIAPQLLQNALIEWFSDHSIDLERTYALNKGVQYE